MQRQRARPIVVQRGLGAVPQIAQAGARRRATPSRCGARPEAGHAGLAQGGQRARGRV